MLKSVVTPRTRARRSGSRRARARGSLVVVLLLGAACGGSADDAPSAADSVVDGAGGGGDDDDDRDDDRGDTPSAAIDLPADVVSATPMDAPTEIDVPAAVVISEAVDPDGAELTSSGMTIRIPAGAVVDSTTLEVVELQAPFQANPYAADEPDAIPIALAGPTFDVGPAGVEFDEPVEVVLPYDPAPVDDELDALTVAYWTGERWSLLPVAVDADARTVTIRLSSFDGTVVTPAWGAKEAIEDGLRTAFEWGGKAVKWAGAADPITAGEASAYVTPDAPEIKAAADGATVDGVPLADEVALAKHLAELDGEEGKIALPGPDGTPRNFSYSAGTGSNWQRPTDHIAAKPTGENFNGVPALGDMRGDCTDVTNTMTSIFISLGYPAKAVFGYTVDKQSPHVWTEVLIGGKPYIVHENGEIQELEEAFARARLIRPSGLDGRAVEWTDQGQTEYVENWWESLQFTDLQGSWTGTITWVSFTPPPKRPDRPRCTSNDGLPLRVELQLELTDQGDGWYFMHYYRGGVSCWAYEPDDPLGESYWEAPGEYNDAGQYGLQLRRFGNLLVGTDPLGAEFTGLLSKHSSGTTTISGTVVRNGTDSGVLSGTWVARQLADAD